MRRDDTGEQVLFEDWKLISVAADDFAVEVTNKTERFSGKIQAIEQFVQGCIQWKFPQFWTESFVLTAAFWYCSRRVIFPKN